MPDNSPRANIEAEQSILGAMILDAEIVPTALANVREDEFYLDKHRVIFRTLSEMSSAGQVSQSESRGKYFDILVLSAELRAKGVLDKVGGTEYLAELTDVTPTTSHTEEYCRLVAGEAAVRRCTEHCNAVLSLARAHAGPEDVLTRFSQAQASVEPMHTQTPVTLLSALDEVFSRLQANKEQTFLPTGLSSLDKILHMSEGQVIVLAARPSQGKSALAGQIALHAANQTSKAALFVSLEMPRAEVVQRLMASRSMVPLHAIRSSSLSEQDYSAMVAAANVIHQSPLYFMDEGELSLFAIGSRARHIQATVGLSVVVIDYLQLMPPIKERESREREIGDLSRALKRLAKSLHVPIIVLSQLNRKLADRSDKRPQMSDLRESGAIEQDADTILFVHREEVYDKETSDKGKAELIIAKQRNGATDTIKVKFEKEFTRFEDLDESKDTGEYSVGGYRG